ncbi:MAG: HPr family phosphocarrier protein [Oscillospiraceae bacterium]|jgi:phosphocarrier protein|nr:HPr family phosphocarrier protein [Oscillospiraceae bacterium]
MERMEYVIKDPDGIHARPAGIFVKRMQEFPCAIQVEKGDKKADGKKLFAVMKMAVKKGDAITITADGEREAEAIAAVASVFAETGL